MDSFWQYLAGEYDAHIEGDRCRFGNATDFPAITDEQTALCALPQYGFLSIEGPDAQTFLQGQTTCDFRQIGTEQARAGAYCTPKGRMITSYCAGTDAENRFLLRMRRSVIGPSREVLGKYIVFSKAEASDASDAIIALGLCGKRAAELLERCAGSCPGGAYASAPVPGGLIVQMDEEGQRFELWLREEQARELWERLAGEAQPADSALWQLLNIRAGIGEVSAATREEFLPQDFNFQLTGGVNFKKGCYTGQEVIARMHYRGKLKRHLYRAVLQAPAPAPGSVLFAGDNAQSVGSVVDAVDTGSGRSELLAVLSEKAVEGGDIHPEGIEEYLEIVDLPYALEEA